MRTCTTHHHACDCREAAIQDALVMLHVFRGCIKEKMMPHDGSKCHNLINDILGRLGYIEEPEDGE